MDTTILKVNNNSEWAAKAKGKAIASPSVEILEEDEDGIPIAHRDFIMELSKEVKRGFAKRYFKAMEEKYAEK